jgi:hypothetical protein
LKPGARIGVGDFGLILSGPENLVRLGGNFRDDLPRKLGQELRRDGCLDQADGPDNPEQDRQSDQDDDERSDDFSGDHSCPSWGRITYILPGNTKGR